MIRTIEKLFRAPYSIPNGIQFTREGLWIADQITDRLALMEFTPPNEYGVSKFIRDLPTESSNTSGLTYGEGSLWVAANGPASLWRGPRPTDAHPGTSDILRVDPATGRTLQRYPLPGGGGTHGVEYDEFEPGTLWLTTLASQTLTQVRIADWSILRTLPLPYPRAHGVVRVEDGIWVVHTANRVIVKLDLASGSELDRIDVPAPHPEPHCLCRAGADLLYCDATTGWVVRISQ